MVCGAEIDSVWGLVFPATVAGFSYSQQCPQNGTGTTSGITIIPCDCVLMCCIGTVTRFCTLVGVWEAVNIDNCTREVFSSLNDRVRLLQLLYYTLAFTLNGVHTINITGKHMIAQHIHNKIYANEGE